MGKAGNCGLRTEPHRRIRENFSGDGADGFSFSHFCTESPSGMHIPCPEPLSGIKKQAPPELGRRFCCMPDVISKCGRPVVRSRRTRREVRRGCGKLLLCAGAIGLRACSPKVREDGIFRGRCRFFLHGWHVFSRDGQSPGGAGGKKRQGNPENDRAGDERGLFGRRKGDPGRWEGAGGREEKRKRGLFPYTGRFPETAGSDQMSMSLNIRIHSRAMYS